MKTSHFDALRPDLGALALRLALGGMFIAHALLKYFTFTLPGTVDATRIKAGMENGVLTIHMPKRTSSAARRVPIGGSENGEP